MRHKLFTTLKVAGGGGASVSSEDLGAFAATVRNPSVSKSFDITGTASNVTPPSNQWELSLNDADWSSSLSNVTDSSVYVRYAPTLGGTETPGGNIDVDGTSVAVSILGKNPLVRADTLAYSVYDLAILHIAAESDPGVVLWPSANQLSSDYDLENATAAPTLDLSEMCVIFGSGIKRLRGTTDSGNHWVDGADDATIYGMMKTPGRGTNSGLHITGVDLYVFKDYAYDSDRNPGLSSQHTYSGSEPTGYHIRGMMTERNYRIQVFRDADLKIGPTSNSDTALTASNEMRVGDISSSGLSAWELTHAVWTKSNVLTDRADYATYLQSLHTAALAL